MHILEPIAGFEVKLRRSDGQAVDVKGGGPPGVTRRVALPQPEGRFHYEGELVVHFPGADTGAMPLSFDTEVLRSAEALRCAGGPGPRGAHAALPPLAPPVRAPSSRC